MKNIKNFRNILKLLILFFLIIFLIVSEVKDDNLIKTEAIVLNKSFTINAMIEEDFEVTKNDLYVAKATFTGNLTGYAADCPMCRGTLACKSSYDVYKNNVVTYPDTQYGNVMIVASSKALQCGSIIRFKSTRVSSDEVYAIVLDRGVLGYNIDLLVSTENYASKYIGRSQIQYDVVRFGW